MAVGHYSFFKFHNNSFSRLLGRDKPPSPRSSAVPTFPSSLKPPTPTVNRTAGRYPATSRLRDSLPKPTTAGDSGLPRPDLGALAGFFLPSAALSLVHPKASPGHQKASPALPPDISSNSRGPSLSRLIPIILAPR
ncbi:hypothetical protein BGZ61DRAFT_472849 [Ilyonectria robusta]|uniref:uncharacterized protein n=1 Tax=Ilyonectria robusta TaxID=1079257 RepID=UPI001E8E329F|nr:uncharacterized protein BGZ61DRAFT_472849 [Ilyonectria robusta]KAH8736529.1 hypothetical protein BGZ61DRAFT_472849 [Ilyonectria robusta]